MKENQILVIIKEPGKAPRVEPLFDNDLKAFQKAVGGYIETVTLATDLVIICNEEGRLKELPYNRLASMFYGEMYHGQPILGDVIFACYEYDYLISMDRAEKVVEDMLNCFRFLRRSA